MFLVTVTDTAGQQVQINGANIAYYSRDPNGKGTVIALAVAGEGGLVTLRVSDTPEAITTLVNAKLRK
jgi:hypothetical protein